MEIVQSPSLLELLRRQPLARREQIAGHWACPSPEAVVLHRHILSNPGLLTAVVEQLPKTRPVRTLLVDMMQEYGTPMTLYPEDRAARRTLAERGLLFSWAAESRGRPKQSGWMMPLEVAILCAQSVPIYRLGLPLLLGNAGPEAITAMRSRWGLPSGSDFMEEVLDLAAKLADREWLGQVLYDPDWNEHLFTLQIVLEWSGVCHRQELFSYAWGDDTLRPFAGRGQQAQEKQVEASLFAYGLLFEYTPPADCGDPECTINHEEVEPLIVLPEEIRAAIWRLGREMQQQAIGSMLVECGGWTAEVRPSPVGPNPEPVDQLKALACVLEASRLDLDESGQLSEAALAQLVALTQTDTRWDALVVAGTAGGVLTGRADGTLSLGPAGTRILDDRPMAWSRALLSRWVSGVGPAEIDQAQNQALGLSRAWLDEASAVIQRGNTESHTAWWRFLDDSVDLPPPQPPDPRRRSHRRRTARPTPTWLATPGDVGNNDVCCGYPRPEDQRDSIASEIALLEFIVTTFRLLLCDLLGGLPRKHPIGRESLAILTQETAAFAVHLGLASLVVDTANHLYVPVRPPTYLVESSADEAFNTLTDAIVEQLLVPAGAAVVRPDGQIVLWPDRLAVDTPRHVDHTSRLAALSGITGVPAGELAAKPEDGHRPLRTVAGGAGESDRRFWLGRPLGELRRAVAGRRVTALRDGYVEVASDESGTP
jgi:hypothetical protein